MTAIVGILNRRGVAFAADSAATHTVSTKHKITNHANKIFELSSRHPVGVCICGNLDFLGMPWEDIFKMFRQKINKSSCASLKDYSYKLFEFVRCEIMPKLVIEQKANLRFCTCGFFDEILKISRRETEQENKGDEEKAMNLKMYEKLQFFDAKFSSTNKCIDFANYSEDDFKKYASDTIEDVLKDTLLSKSCLPDFLQQFSKTLYLVVTSINHVYLAQTELIFWGYGEEDIFPSCFSFEISSAFDSRIKYTPKCEYVVSDDNHAVILPFAQADIVSTVIRGVDANLEKIIYDMYRNHMTTVIDAIETELQKAGAPIELRASLMKIKSNSEIYEKDYSEGIIQYIQENYVDSLINVVSCLGKEDLADMTESLVKMACLKKRITPEEESVGGPVDVAVITKGDGFIWMKRKHYFSAELNPHYFERSKFNEL